MKKYIILLLGHLFVTSLLHSQYYINLGDVSGIDISPYQTKLNNAAHELIDSLPTGFQNNFKVFSTAFYLHQADFQTGIPSEFERAIDSADSKSTYNILFGKEFNEIKQFSKYWVRIKLPQSGIFSCYHEEDLALIHSKLTHVLNENQVISDQGTFVSAEINAIQLLISEISKAKFCCANGRSLYSCTACPDDISSIKTMLEQYGFVQIPINSLIKSVKFDTTGNVDEYSSLLIQRNGETIDVNNDIEIFLNKMGVAIEGVSGKIFYYSPTDIYCGKVMDAIIEDIPEDYYSLLGTQSKSRDSRDNELFTFKVTVIGLKDNENNPFLYLRIVESEEQSVTGHKIFLRCLDGCGFEMEDVRDTVEYFYSLLGTYFVPGNILIGVNLVPEIINVDYQLSAEQVNNNTIVLFGTPSKLVSLVRRQKGGDEAIYAPIAPHFNNTFDELAEFFDPHLDLLEVGHPFLNNKPGRICLIRKDLGDHIAKFNARSKDELAAFLTFHATGHNSGIDHDYYDRSIPKPYEMGYMSRGCIIISYYLGKSIPYNSDPEYQCPSYVHAYQYSTLDSFVEETMNSGIYVNYIKSKIYDRFIK